MKLYLSKIYSLPCLLAFNKTNIANLPTGSSQYMNISELYRVGGWRGEGRELFALTMIIWILNGCMDIFRVCVLNGSTGGLWYSEKSDKQLSKLSSDRMSGIIFRYCCYDIFSSSVELRPNAGHGVLTLEVSRSHTTTHHSR